MAFDSAYYTSLHQAEFTPLNLTPEAHYLMTGWERGYAPSTASTSLTADEVLGLFANTGDKFIAVVNSLNADQIAYLDSSNNLDVGALLGGLDDASLADFMQGWDSSVLSYLDQLPSFDLAATLGDFDPTELMGLMSEWGGGDSLEFLADLPSFDFADLVGADPNQMMTLLESLDPALQNKVYMDFGAQDFAWLDGALDFDLSAMMASNFDFFREVMPSEEALGLFGYVGGNLNQVVQGLNSADLAFLDAAQGFDLGSFFETLDDSMLAGFMEGWGSEELAYLGGLEGFDLAGNLEAFDPTEFQGLLSAWDDPEALTFLSDLDGFDFSTMLGDMPDSAVSGLIGEWDPSMLDALSGVGGDFDLSSWIVDAGAEQYLPDGYDFEIPDSQDSASGGYEIPDNLVDIVGSQPSQDTEGNEHGNA